MKLTRRKFIGAAPIVVGAIGAVSGRTPGELGLSEAERLASMSFLAFHAQLNTDFLFTGPSGRARLRLVEVADSRPPAEQRWDDGQENFVLRFDGAKSLTLDQGTYKVSHFALGEFHLFITEGSKFEDTQRFIAVINRVIR